MKPGGLSIRYKILLLLSTLPVVALSTYLFVALSIFKNDKLAYVFDSSRTVSGSVAAQVRTELSALRDLVQAISQGFNYIDGTLRPFASRIFQQDPSIEAMMFFLPDGNGGYRLSDRLEKVPGTLMELGREPGLIEGWLKDIKEKNFGLYTPFGDDRVVLGTAFGRPGDQTHFVVLTLVHAEVLNASFAAEGVYRIFLVRPNGELLFGPQTEKLGLLQDRLPIDFLIEAQQKRQPSGVREVIDSSDNETLASYSQVGFADLIVVALVKKAQALQAVQVLMRKSILFFIALISATGILSVFASRRVTSALMHLSAATKRIAQGHFGDRVTVTSRDEIGELATGFNFMASEVQRLLMDTAEKVRMESELQTAHMVQETLFPPATATLNGIRVAGHYQPASECGGDWWHYSEVDGKVVLWIGDATGHGAPAALITSAAKSAASIIETLGATPAEALRLLNQAIYNVAKGKLMMTFLVASYDPLTGELTYASASHEPAFLISKKDAPLKRKDLVPLNEVNGKRLGHAPDSTYVESRIKVRPGDTLFFYTDGIPDLQSPKGEILGERTFLNYLLSSVADSSSAIESAEIMRNKIESYREDTPLLDDVTYLYCRFDELCAAEPECGESDGHQDEDDSGHQAEQKWNSGIASIRLVDQSFEAYLSKPQSGTLKFLFEPEGSRYVMLTEGQGVPALIETLCHDRACVAIFQSDNLYSLRDWELWTHSKQNGISHSNLPNIFAAPPARFTFAGRADKTSVTGFFEELFHGRSRRFCESAHIIVEELFMNATIDAPREYELKIGGGLETRALEKSEFVYLEDESRGYIFCCDPYGSLTIPDLMDHLAGVYAREDAKVVNLKDDGRGAGLGAFLMLENTSTMFVGVIPGQQTLVGFALPFKFSYREREHFKRNICILKLSEKEA